MKIIIQILILLFLISCRKSDADTPQQIDQTVQLYIDSAGVNMLNQSLPNTYHTVAMKDLGGIYDQTAITGFSIKQDANSVYYLEYLNGAKRILIDSASATKKTYESAILLQLTKPINDSVSKTTADTMKIRYSWTPTLFQISKIYYNSKLKFTKTTGQPNTLIINK